jgi:prophage regulatory protein
MTTHESFSAGRQSGRLLKMRDVVEQTSLHRATIYRLEARGEFPRRRQITRGRVGWWESDVEAWKAQRQAASE